MSVGRTAHSIGHRVDIFERGGFFARCRRCGWWVRKPDLGNARLAKLGHESQGVLVEQTGDDLRDEA